MLFAWAKTAHSVPIACRAAVEFHHAIKLRHNESAPLIGLGKTYLALGQLKKAVPRFRRAVQADKKNDEAKSLLQSTKKLISDKKPVPVANCG